MLMMYSDGMVEDRVGGITGGLSTLLGLAEPLIIKGGSGTARAILEAVPPADDRSVFVIRRPVPGQEPPGLWARLSDRFPGATRPARST